jgi:hypothetical protein
VLAALSASSEVIAVVLVVVFVPSSAKLVETEVKTKTINVARTIFAINFFNFLSLHVRNLSLAGTLLFKLYNSTSTSYKYKL